MPAKLDAVPWNERKHAFGSAKDVPAALKTLTGKNESKRRGAFDRLQLALVDPPRAHDAAREAVPFLVAIAEDPKAPDRHLPLRLLADIAVGGHAYRIVTGFDPADPRVAEELVDPELQAAQERVCGHFDALSALLEDGEAAIRAGAALVLAQLHDRAADARRCLLARQADEQDDHARASMRVALGMTGKYLGTEDDAALLCDSLDEDEGLVRLAAALGLAYLPGDHVDDRVADRLAEAVGSPPVEPRLFPWDDGQIGWHAYALLVEHRPERAESALVDALRRAADAPPEDTRAFDLSAALLSLTMPGFAARRDDPVVASELTEAQRRAITALSPFDVPGPFADYGLPRDAEDRRRLLGADARGPLDEEVTFTLKKKEITWPWWRVFRAADARKLSAKALAELLSELSATERLDVLADAAMRPYGLFVPKPKTLAAALDDAEGELASWWPDQADRLLSRLEAGGKVQPAAAAFVMQAAVRSGEPIDERYRPLLQRSISATAPDQSIEILDGLAPERREDLVLAYIDDVATRLPPARALNNGLPFLARCGTAGAARRIADALVSPPPGGSIDQAAAKKALVALGQEAVAALDEALAGEAAHQSTLKAARKAIK